MNPFGSTINIHGGVEMAEDETHSRPNVFWTKGSRFTDRQKTLFIPFGGKY